MSEENIIDMQQKVCGVDGPVGPGLQHAGDARAEPLLLQPRAHAQHRRTRRAHYVRQPALESDKILTHFFVYRIRVKLYYSPWTSVTPRETEIRWRPLRKEYIVVLQASKRSKVVT